jgi:hypothetical protein
MKRLALGLALAALVSACRGGDSDPPREPTATAAAGAPAPVAGKLTDADVLAVVPPDWGLLDWALAPDGAYAAVVTQAPRANNFGSARVASVYAPSARGPIEVARVGHVFGEIALDSGAGKTIAAYADGARFIDVLLPGGPYAQIRLSPSGQIAIEYLMPLGDSEPAMTFTPATDPLAEITVPATEGETGAWTVPAGAVPAGWMVTGAKTSPDGRYVAVTTQPLANAFGGQFSVYRIDGDRLQEEFRGANEYMSLHDVRTLPAGEDLVFTDVNGDGAPDIVYSDSFGGTGWLNHSTRAVTINDDGSVRPIEFELPIPQSSPSGPEDIDGDGVYEWWAIDASWELAGFCHACSPASQFVLAWNGEKYADASARFADAIIERSRWEASAELPVTCGEQDAYLATLISRFLDRHNAAHTADAAGVLSQIRALSLDPQLEAKRAQIVETLETAPHAPYQIEWMICE